MDVIRRNTDYAFRIITMLKRTWGSDNVLSARILSKQLSVPYSLTCKLLQRLQREGYIESIMGPRGGFKLSKPPGQITFLELIETIQGPISINRCQMESFSCPLENKCPLCGKFLTLQKEMVNYLKQVTIGQLTENDGEGIGDV